MQKRGKKEKYMERGRRQMGGRREQWNMEERKEERKEERGREESGHSGKKLGN
jgi:hypothetical protein